MQSGNKHHRIIFCIIVARELLSNMCSCLTLSWGLFTITSVNLENSIRRTTVKE